MTTTHPITLIILIGKHTSTIGGSSGAKFNNLFQIRQIDCSSGAQHKYFSSVAPLSETMAREFLQMLEINSYPSSIFVLA